MNNHSDTKQKALVSGLLQGESRAVEQLILTHQSWMLTLAARILNDEHLAEDCVQESLIVSMRKIDTFRGDSSFKTWLKRIVINNCLMKLRQQKRRNELHIEDLMPQFDRHDCRIETSYSVIDTPETLLQRHENIEQIHAIIKQLPNDYRVVLLLRDIEELNTQEVATLLGCSEGTVKVRLHRARSALKKRLEPMMCQ